MRIRINRRIEAGLGAVATLLGGIRLDPIMMSALVSGELVKRPTRAARIAAWAIVLVRNMAQIDRSSVA